MGLYDKINVASQMQNMPFPLPQEQQASPVIPAAAPQSKGLLATLARIFTPEAGTFWDSAWKNGLMGARSGQQDYRTGQAEAGRKAGLVDAQTAEATANAAKATEAASRGYDIAGNNIVTKGADGQPQFVAPPAQPDRVERLIDQWNKAKPGPLRDLLERAILHGDATAVIAERGAVAERTATTKAKMGAKYRASGIPPLPPGFSVVQ